MTLTVLAFAQSPQAQPTSLGWLWPVQLILIAAVFYFLILRPQSQARKKHADILSALKKGDEIMTAGGLVGRVKEIKDDRVTLESGTATLVVDRARIVRVGDQSAPGVGG